MKTSFSPFVVRGAQPAVNTFVPCFPSIRAVTPVATMVRSASIEA
jgi:hypothetical protein